MTLQVADLKQATRVIVVHHYLHRGRTMAQLPYWIKVDDRPVGVLLFAFPRLSVPLHGFPPMNLIELARMWLHPDVQGDHRVLADGVAHATSIASCSIAKSLRRLQEDWYLKYPNLPEVRAVVSWADSVHHEGTIYRAANFADMGQSGGTLHGSTARRNGGRDQLNTDYLNKKKTYLFKFAKPLTASRKRQLEAMRSQFQLSLRLL